MRLLLIWTAALLLISQAVLAQEAPDVKEALKEWVAAVESGNVDNVLKLYDKDAIMYSTFGVKPMMNQSSRRSYFKKIVVNPDIKVEVTDSHPRRFGEIALNSGLYTLSYTQEGAKVITHARFTFAYALKDGKWLIVDQHSSKVPAGDEVR